MEQKLLGWTTFLWSRKYMFSWLHWHGTCCHLGVLRKHLACFLTCCSILSQWSHQRALYTQKNVTKCQTFNLTQCCLLWAFAIRLIIPVLQVEELRQKCLRAVGWAFIWHVCQAPSHMQCPHLKPCPRTLLSSCPQLLPVYTTSTDI